MVSTYKSPFDWSLFPRPFTIGLYDWTLWLVSICKPPNDWSLLTNLLMIGLYLQADLWLVSICKPPHDWSLFVSPLMIGLYSKVAFQKFFFFLLTFGIGNFSPEHTIFICSTSVNGWQFIYILESPDHLLTFFAFFQVLFTMYTYFSLLVSLTCFCRVHRFQINPNLHR